MSSARLLILGTLIRKQPIHGYDIRRELEISNVEHWANVAYGSIYFALNKMAEEGLVEAVGNDEQSSKRAGRTEYKITEQGKFEFFRMLRQAWWERKDLIDPFQVALAFMDQMSKDELLMALRYRIDLLRSMTTAFKWGIEAKSKVSEIPRFVIEQQLLALAHDEVELSWTEELLAKVEQGELP